MELGLVYTPVMAIPPKQHTFYLTGYCTSKCTKTVCVQNLINFLVEIKVLVNNLDVFVFFLKFRKLPWKVSCPVCLLLSPGFAPRRDLYFCIPAAHPPGRPWSQNSFGEGRQRTGGGAGRPALQHRLPGKDQCNTDAH